MDTIDTQAQLDAVANEFKEFAYIVSHDLGAPLRSMVEFSKLLKLEQLDALNDDGRLYLSLIVDSGEKLQGMLSALLDYSRLNTIPMITSAVNLDLVVKQSQVALKERLASSKTKITIAKLPTITGDADQLQQLFTILIENAVKFVSPGSIPQISVGARAESGGTTFTVKDDGIGIDPEFHEHIFKTFKRLHRDDEFPGVGMGLAMAKKIADCHNARIWVESGGGKGSTFYIHFPGQGVES